MLAMTNLFKFALLALIAIAAAMMVFSLNQIFEASDQIIASPAAATSPQWSIGCGNNEQERQATQMVTELTVRNGTTRFTNAQGRRVVTTLPCQAISL